METNSLLCTEVLEPAALGLGPSPAREIPRSEVPVTVPAVQDTCQLADSRVLQNLLRNEEASLPPVVDYFKTVQNGSLTPEMRKIVTDWMLEVVHEQQSAPEIFALAVNFMDRFLCMCQIGKAQLQLLGSVCLLIASKVREPCPIPGHTLITYTDNSITAEEIKEWELLVLYKLQWQLSAITALDYLDHILPRLDLDKAVLGASCSQSEAASLYSDLRRLTETTLVLCATEYQFAYHPPSLLAASATLLMLRTMKLLPTGAAHDALLREMQLRLQTVTHTATEHMRQCILDMDVILPSYLKCVAPTPPSPDSTTSDDFSSSPVPDLECPEVLSSPSPEGGGLFSCQELSPSTTSSSTTSLTASSSSPLSAVDIFTDFSTNVLQAQEQDAYSNSFLLVN